MDDSKEYKAFVKATELLQKELGYPSPYGNWSWTFWNNNDHDFTAEITIRKTKI